MCLCDVCCRSEEPASTNMDISTGHVVLVSHADVIGGDRIVIENLSRDALA